MFFGTKKTLLIAISRLFLKEIVILCLKDK